MCFNLMSKKKKKINFEKIWQIEAFLNTNICTLYIYQDGIG